MEKTVGYRKVYKLRILVKGRKYVSVAMPYEVIEREAAIRELTVTQFLEGYEAVAEYDNFDGVRYTFKESEAVK